MMVSIVSHFLQVVVFSAYAKTLLRVGNTLVFRRMVAQYDVFKLVHACIGKHQRRVILDDHRCRRHNLMSFRLEKLNKRVADFISC